MTNFAERLTELRIEKGLNRLQLANELKFTERSIGRWENGETIPDIETFAKFVMFFKCSADYLLGTEN